MNAAMPCLPNWPRSPAWSLSTIIAATVVSVGIARASVADGVIGNEGGLFTIALLLGVVFIVLGGLASLKPTKRPHH